MKMKSIDSLEFVIYPEFPHLPEQGTTATLCLFNQDFALILIAAASSYVGNPAVTADS